MINKKICLLSAIAISLFSSLLWLPRTFQNSILAQNQQEVGDTIAEENDETEATSATTQSLKERIEKVVEEKESRNGTVAGQSNYSTRSIVGVVERLSESAITIRSLKGSVIIPITDDVEITKDGQEIQISDIAIENSAIVLGLQTGETFTPIKVIIDEDDLMPRPQIVEIGAIEQATATNLVISSRTDRSSKSITLNQRTNIIDVDNEEIPATYLFEDVQVIVAGYAAESSSSNETTRIAQIVKALVNLERTE
jgi:protease II